MVPLIFLWFLGLTVSTPHRIIFIRSPSEIGPFLPASEKQNFHRFNFANELDNSKDEDITTASSIIETHHATDQPSLIYQLPLYQRKSTLPLRVLSNSVSPQPFKRSDLHVSSPIPKSRFRILIDTSSQSAVQPVVDYSDNNKPIGDSSYGTYQPASHISLQPHELTKNDALVSEIIYGDQLISAPLPPSSFNQPKYLSIPEPIYKQHGLGFQLEFSPNTESIYEQNYLGVQSKLSTYNEPIYKQKELGFQPDLSPSNEPIYEQEDFGVEPEFSPNLESIYEQNDLGFEDEFTPDPEAIYEQNYPGFEVESSPDPEAIYKQNYPGFEVESSPDSEAIYEQNDPMFLHEYSHTPKPIHKLNDFAYQPKLSPSNEPIQKQNDIGFEAEFSPNPETIYEQSVQGIQLELSPNAERIYKKNYNIDENIFRGTSSLASPTSGIVIPLQNYSLLQRVTEPTPLDIGALKDSIILAPVNYMVQNIPFPPHEETNVPSQQYISTLGRPNISPVTTTTNYKVPSQPTCSSRQILSYDGICLEVEIIRTIYSFSEPKDDRPPEEFRGKPTVHKPKVKLNLVVIQANENVSGKEPLIVPPPQEKTVVLVLKKDGEKERKVIEVSAPAGDSPEVFFVNYKDGENPVLPGGIDLHTALSSSTKLGERIRPSSAASAFPEFESMARSSYKGPQLKDYNKRVHT